MIFFDLQNGAKTKRKRLQAKKEVVRLRVIRKVVQLRLLPSAVSPGVSVRPSAGMARQCANG